MNSLLRSRPKVVFLSAVLCVFVFISTSHAQHHVRWIGNRPLSPAPALRVGSAPDSVNLLALMVEFQEDSDSQTEGTGRFDTTVYTGRAIDPPPHDLFHFQSKVQFVSNYFRKVSNGKLTVSGDVLPSIVTVSGMMSDYSRDTEPEFRGLARLAVEAWSIADTVFSGVDLSAYDGYVLFHAGAGKDIDLVSLYGFDPNPNDIPSIYLSLDGFRKALDSTAFNGISVRGGTHLVTNTMILPETESRVTGSGSSADTLMISINGLFAASVGSHIGLPDLFETSSGISAIGQHGLMDGASIFAYYGLFPPEPSAWEKIHLGWVDPIVVDQPLSTLTIPAVSLTATVDTVYKVPINASEYYLVENRNRDPLNNGQRLTVVRDGVSSIVTIPKDSSFYFSFDNVSGVNGSVTDVEDFDWALIGFMTDEPAYVGGGILIWHIDDAVAQAGIPSNSVNADPARRGVDLEEADGSQDIGQLYEAFTGGSGSEFGSPLDCWYDGNLAVIYKNAFDAASYPSTHANTGARSLVSIRDFSPRGPRMTFTVEYGASDISSLPGFPKRMDGVPSAAVAFDTDGDGVSELFTTVTRYSGGGATGTPVGPSRLLGWMSTGVSLFDPADSGGTIAEVTDAQIGVPAIFRVAGQPYVAAASPDNVYVWSLADGNADTRVDSALVHAVPVAGEPWRIAAVDSYIVAYGPSGISAFSITGRQVFSDSEPHLLAATGEGAVIARGRGMSLRITDLNGLLSESQADLGGPIRALAAGYAEPGRLLLAVLTGTPASGVVRLFEPSGTSLTERATLDPTRFLLSGESLDGSLVLADIDKDGPTDIVLTTSTGRTLALNVSGILLQNFPVNTHGTSTAAPLLVRPASGAGTDIFRFDSSGSLHQTVEGVTSSVQLGDPGLPSAAFGRVTDGSLSVLSLFTVQSSGRIGAWKLGRSVSAADLLWPMATGDASGSYFTAAVTQNPSALGSGLLPADRTYNWPNPVYDDVTYIRYFSDRDGTVTVDILDLAGDKISQLTGTAVAGQDGEIPWNVSGIQSGVYLARIGISAGGTTAERVIKIAVIR